MPTDRVRAARPTPQRRARTERDLGVGREQHRALLTIPLERRRLSPARPLAAGNAATSDLGDIDAMLELSTTRADQLAGSNCGATTACPRDVTLKRISFTGW